MFSGFWVKGAFTKLVLIGRMSGDVVACVQAPTGSKTRSVQRFRETKTPGRNRQ